MFYGELYRKQPLGRLYICLLVHIATFLTCILPVISLRISRSVSTSNVLSQQHPFPLIAYPEHFLFSFQRIDASGSRMADCRTNDKHLAPSERTFLYESHTRKRARELSLSVDYTKCSRIQPLVALRSTSNTRSGHLTLEPLPKISLRESDCTQQDDRGSRTDYFRKTAITGAEIHRGQKSTKAFSLDTAARETQNAETSFEKEARSKSNIRPPSGYTKEIVLEVPVSLVDKDVQPLCVLLKRIHWLERRAAATV